jgi:hypothetical protein
VILLAPASWIPVAQQPRFYAPIHADSHPAKEKIAPLRCGGNLFFGLIKLSYF